MTQRYAVGQQVEYEPTGETVTVRGARVEPPLHSGDPPSFTYSVETALGERWEKFWGSKLNPLPSPALKGRLLESTSENKDNGRNDEGHDEHDEYR